MTDTPLSAPVSPRRNRTVAYVLVALVAGMVGLAYAAVPIYRIFCSATAMAAPRSGPRPMPRASSTAK